MSSVTTFDPSCLPEPDPKLTPIQQKQQALLRVLARIRVSSDLAMLTTIVTEVRQLLEADRVAIFQFVPGSGWKEGEFVAEDVVPSFASAIAKKQAGCFGEQYATYYQAGQFQAVADIHDAGLRDCDICILAELQIRSNLVVPLLQKEHLWGLLCVHQCANPRQWQPEEITSVQHIALHLASAIQQIELLKYTQQQLVQLQIAQMELTKSHQKLSLLVQHNPLAVIEWNTDFEVISWNSAAEEIFGYSQQEALGRHIAGFLVPASAKAHVNEVIKSLLTLSGGVRSTNENITKDGRTITCEWYNTPLTDLDGQVVGVLSMTQDISDRKLAEEVLRQQEQFLRSIFEGVSYNIFVVDVTDDGAYHYAMLNPVAEQQLRLQAEQYRGKTPADLFPPTVAAAIHKKFTTCVHSGTSINAEDRLNFQGVEKWHLSTLTPLRDDTGKVHRLIGTSVDITDRKQTETALHQALQKTEYQSRLLRTVIDATPDWIFAKDRNFRYFLVNNSFANGIGKSIEDILGKNDLELGFPEEQVFGNPDKAIRGFRTDDVTALAGEIVHNPYDPATVADGSLRIFDAQKMPLQDSEGNIFAVLGFSRDVTASRQVEAQLREQARREQLLNHLASQIRSSLDLGKILETTVQAIRNLLHIDRCVFVWYRPYATPPTWEATHEASPELPSVLGLYPSESIGSTSEKLLNLEVIREDDVSAIADPIWRQLLFSLEIKSNLCIPIKTHTGDIGVISCSHHRNVRFWTDSEVDLLESVANQLGIAIDQAELYKRSRKAAATAQAKAEELEQTLQELQRMQSQLVQSEKMSSLGQLVAGVAHEINNPVSFIFGNLTHADGYIQDLLHLLTLYQKHHPYPHPEVQAQAEAIDLKFLIEDLPKLLSSMKVGADRIQTIVRSLRNFSRMDEAEMKAVDIHEGIDNTLLILQNRLKDKPDSPGIEVIKKYGNLPLVECYAGQLNQVFMNIISNAIYALEERDRQRTLEEIQHSPSQICISTEITDSHQLKIRLADNGPGISQEVKQRLFDPFFTTKPVGKGVGLGMSISYQIVTERHGGTLLCNSELGQGAEFVIEIPLQQV